MKKIIVVLTLMLLAFASPAEEPVSEQAGEISSFTGKVLLYDGESPRPADVTEENTAVYVKNRVTTKRESTAVIDLCSGDRAALTESSTMTITGIEEYEPGAGRVIFKIKKRGEISGMKVALTSSVIGVKGTEFLIDTDENGKNNIYLKEGKIEVTSLEGQFKKYGEVQIDEYEAYVRKMMGEYDKYVTELAEQYVEYVNGFVMEAGTAYSVDGSEVRRLEFTDDIEDAFKLLDETE